MRKSYWRNVSQKSSPTSELDSSDSPPSSEDPSQESQKLKLNPSEETLKDAKTPDSRDRLINLAKQWGATLTQSDDHHDINNVIGPSILVDSSNEPEVLVDALLTRLSWCGHDFESVNKDKWKWGASDGVEKLAVFAIDDQLQAGWDRAVCRLVKEKPKDTVNINFSNFVRLNESMVMVQQDEKHNPVQIYGCLGPDPLISFLENACYDQRDYSQQIHKNKSVVMPEIILLDLRLYNNADTERDVACKLLGIVKNKNLTPDKLAWEGIDRDEISEIEKWIDNEIEDSNKAAQTRDKALLLLPQLLALALPLTPIILFSATSQAWVKEILKPYQNIFTGFEKPRVLSSPESVESSIVALHEGLDKAVKMIRLRLQLAHAQKAVSMAENDRPKEEDRICDHHVEIYADETGKLKTGITSGFAVCMFENLDFGLAEKLQQRLFKEYKNSGTVWARKEGETCEPDLKKGTDLATDDTECCNQVELLNTLLQDTGLCQNKRKSWSVVATRMPPSKNCSEDVSLAAFPDNMLDNAIRFNLEFTLYVLMPYLSKSSFEGKLHLYLPTRDIPTENKEHAEALCDAFDLPTPLNDKISTWTILLDVCEYKFGNAFPIIRGWLHDWGNVGGVSSKIQKIKMTSLGTQKISQDQAQERRLFHDIADWACTASKKHDKNRGEHPPNWIEPLTDALTNRGIFSHWFVSTDGEHNNGQPWYKDDTKNAMVLMQTLRASSHQSSKGQNSDVLRLLLRNTYINKCDPRLLESKFCSQQRLILWKLRNELNHAKGKVLHILCAED